MSTPLLALIAGGAGGLAIYVIPYLPELRRAVATHYIRRRTRGTAAIEAAT